MVICKSLWLLLAGAVLLLPGPALAESYIRVDKKGVIYYYFNNRGAATPRPKAENLPKVPPNVWVQESLPLPATSGKAPLKQKIPANLAITPLPGLPSLWQVLPSRAPAPPEHSGERIPHLPIRLDFFDSPVISAVPPCATGDEAGESDEEVCLEPGIMLPDQRSALVQAAVHRSVVASPLSSKLSLGQQIAPGASQQLALCLKVSPRQVYSFPVAWPFTFRDTWGDPRSGGRLHQAVDIVAPEGTEVYAVTSGVIQILGTYPRAGITIFMRGHDGRGYGYMHLQGYAPGLAEGQAVQAGQLIGYVGRTGVQESGAHLHFEVYADPSLNKNSFLNPYSFLVQLCRGYGVSDLNQPRLPRLVPLLARTVAPSRASQGRTRWIQGYRQPWSQAFSAQTAHKTPILEIKRFWE